MRADKLIDHIDDLLSQGAGWVNEDGPGDLDLLLVSLHQPEPASRRQRRATQAAWLTRSQHALRTAFGDKSDHYLAFKSHLNDLPQCMGVLAAARADLADGLLSSVRDLATADAFDDLLDQADHLLKRGYHLPAAALAGAVLEDTLRRLSVRLKCLPRGTPTVATLNAALYKAHQGGDFDGYTNSVQKQVTAWGGLRNDVDHHNFTSPGDIDPGNVMRMIDGVRDFIAKHLA
jgi:hypothetical protein